MSTSTNAAQASADLSNAGMQSFVTLEELRTALQTAGYRAELVTDGNISLLRSASNGLGFDVRPGNSFPGKPDHFADVAFVAVLTVQGSMPLDLVNKWNRMHRFCRLFVDKPQGTDEFLVLTLDLSIAGAVSPNYVRTQLQIWDSLIQQLIPWLREELGRLAASLETAKEITKETAKQATKPDANLAPPRPALNS
ncbi:YbjN domain-containing protein [Bradyrhizobium sp. Ai1a-2]|uniref:YbjN domain-containing protein n=1 Tax=Bradyrhizobium sp. Ai1a-2 TaxID=196490 RepID=UPI0003F599E8|nr:YbjN domain-containing protein [Bradyrhizobium sp. Ai1a-2]